ncbi:MAG: hypothetical protein ACFFFG_08735 [Candidatus Thorarchaeota archaeon]
MKARKYKILSLAVHFIFILAVLVVLPISAQIPVIFPKPLEVDTFVPEDQYDDWLYYINHPGEDYSDADIVYGGISGSQNAEYTSFSNYNEFNEFSLDLERGTFVSDSLLTDNLRYGVHPLFEPEPYPRAVRIPSTFNPIFETSNAPQAISLHMDYSYSFMAEGFTNYFGFLNTSEPFYLDIDIFDGNAEGTIVFPDAHPRQGYSIGYIEKQMTYAFIPKNDSITPLNFTLWLDTGSLVTLTAHSWQFPSYLPSIDVNTTYSGEINQGTRETVSGNTVIFPENEIFSIRIFNISLIENNLYEIFVNFRMLESSGFTSGQPFVFLVSEHADFLGGGLDQNGYQLFAPRNESALLVFFAQGWSVGEYTIFYQNKPKPPDEIVDAAELVFNENFQNPGYYIYYYFTLNSPHMIAMNYTYPGYARYFYFYLYRPGTEPNTWEQISDRNFFEPEYGNLFGDSNTDIGNNWRYFPAGTYAIRFTYYFSSHQFRFTKIPISSPSTVSVSRNSLFAFELPMMRNRINFVNISTNDHKLPNQQVQYEYGWVGKYNEMIRNFYSPWYTWIGNQNISNQWTAWNSNNSVIASFLPTRDYEQPILIIRPYDAQNTTGQFPDPFSAELTVSTNVAQVQHGSFNSWTYIGGGYFIPKNPIIATTSFAVNDDLVAAADHLYGIPLRLLENRIYNITAILHGNYTSGPSSWNATIQDVNVLGGNLFNLEVFNSFNSGSDSTKSWITMLVQTVSSESYLYVDVVRTWDGANYRNATLEVLIEAVAYHYLSFDLPTYNYYSSLLSTEILATQLLASQILAPEMNPRRTPGFELFLSLGTLVIFSMVILGKKRRKDRT